MILDSRIGPIADPEVLARVLQGRTGIVAHGLFLGIAQYLIVGGAIGVRHLRRSDVGHGAYTWPVSHAEGTE